MKIVIFLSLICQVLCLSQNESRLSVDYFLDKNVKYICYFSCKNQHREQFRKNLKKLWLIYTNNKKTLSVPDNKRVAKEFMSSNIRISTARIGKDLNMDLAKTLQQRNVDVGVLLDESCDSSDFILFQVGILFYC